ncbi:putative peptidoglycan-binding domain-containing protein [Cylindrospermum stagnale PCC 7417]|uniref:Putative peptidoglycan-binding domain-containing protein n=1 Tax=Cylindrospermum stagnale PCC 7417 TaxID=56107 RepID=K9WRR6_9NOST|nr:peptidoglycan-binding domain-containing protein [Cylindrospermum stagnale]AFZ23055.1 putative peptidoglycan-binding domain-containing protein [Cylindrospermum stagnale PCC 7417]
MTEIDLPMTGVLNTKQPYLSEQRSFQQENGVQKFTNSQLSQSVPAAQITPPEFIQINGTSQTRLSALAIKKNKILQKIINKYLSSESSTLADAQNLQGSDKDDTKIAIRSQKFNSQPLPILSFGTSGISVRVLQRLLVSNGYGIRVDGVFGPLTEIAVKAFQNQRNLGVDGIVGQKTWGALTI